MSDSRVAGASPAHASALPAILAVPVDRPWLWLQRGWDDMLAARRVSLAYGALVVVASLALALALLGTGTLHLLLPLAGGFLMMAPLLAVGLYETSRRRAAGESMTLALALRAWRRNGVQIGMMGMALLLLHFTWIRVSLLLYALFFNGLNPSLDTLPGVVLTSPVSLPFLIVGTLVGGVLAAITFAISAVSIPMLLDRPETNVFAAIATSIAVVRANPQAMALWAGLIAFFTVGGMVTLFLGLALVLPLIGHASWHAYKDMVGA